MSITQTIGLGSDNRLSMDIIEKLKEVDRKAIINPIDSDISTTEDKKTALSEITSLMESLKSSTDSLSGDNLYLNRSAIVSDSGINVDIDKGVQPQSISIEVTQLAKEEVIQSNTFKSRTDTISDSDGTISIDLNGVSKDFEITSDTTLEEFMQMINDSSLDATAKILNTGTDEYRLVLTSNSTGESNSFSITESDGLKTGLSLDDNIVQNAENSKIVYNGIEVSRSSNSIDDLITGVSLDLTQTTDQPIIIDITEDANSVATEIQNFVDSFNELITKLDDVTRFDETTKDSGVFQGDSNINGIEREIKNLLLDVNSNGNSMMDYGLTLNKSGTLDFNISTFNEKFTEDPDGVEYFFKGEDIESRGVTSHPDGLFYKLDSSLDRYVGINGTLQTLSTSLENQEKRFNEEKEKAVALLDSRYERMAQQFSQQDAIIGQINQQMKALQMQIDAQNNNK